MGKNISSKPAVTAAAFLAFLIFGFMDNVKGPSITDLKADLSFNYAQGANILLFAYIGFVLATLISGYVSDRRGEKGVLSWAGLFICAGAAGYFFVSSLPLLFASSLFIGLGLGSIEVGANRLVSRIHSERKGRFLNLLAFFHGLGSMLAPLYAGLIIGAGFGWRSVYGIGALLSLSLPLFFLLLNVPHERIKTDGEAGSLSELFRLLDKRLVLIAFILLAYVSVEIGMASWMVDYLKEIKNMSVERGAVYLSLYFGFMTLGRFAGSFIIDRIGFLKGMIIATASSVVCMALGIFLPPPFSFLLPLTGFFFSIMFPTATALATEGKEPSSTGTIFSFIFFFAGLGGMIGPWLVGQTANLHSIQTGFCVNIGYGVLMLVLLFVLIPLERKA